MSFIFLCFFFFFLFVCFSLFKIQRRNLWTNLTFREVITWKLISKTSHFLITHREFNFPSRMWKDYRGLHLLLAEGKFSPYRCDFQGTLKSFRSRKHLPIPVHMPAKLLPENTVFLRTSLGKSWLSR